jgi:hypothetical protein
VKPGFFATAACLSFAEQFLSQIGSAPASATLQAVFGAVPTILGSTPGQMR